MSKFQRIVTASLPAAFALAFVAGCDSKPSETECEEAADKFFELLAEDQGNEGAIAEMNKEMADGFKSSCIKEGTKKEVKCIMDAKAFSDIEGCQK